ncbi:hypothetical protein CUMW_163990 [Citrus unshiu]|nr:hypothetical protein CUMW_163990 [Citrus unshiu]
MQTTNRLIEIQFPWQEAGLPEGCENFDMLPSIDWPIQFLTVTSKLQLPFENLFRGRLLQPCCIISDMLHSWSAWINCCQIQCSKDVFSMDFLASVSLCLDILLRVSQGSRRMLSI